MQKSEVTFSGNRQNFLLSESDSSLTMKPKEEQKVTRYHAVESGNFIAFAVSHPMQIIFSFKDLQGAFIVLIILKHLRFASFLFSEKCQVRKTRVK